MSFLLSLKSCFEFTRLFLNNKQKDILNFDVIMAINMKNV